MPKDDNDNVWVVTADGSTSKKRGWPYSTMPSLPTGCLIAAILAGLYLDNLFLIVGAAVLGFIYFSYKFVRSLITIGKTTARAAKIVSTVVKSDTPLKDDSGQGRLTVVSEDQRPQGQVSLQNDEQEGQLALAKAAQKQSQNQ